MSASTNIQSGGLVTTAIKVAGNAIPDIMEVQSITVNNTINRIPTAKITLIDGNPTTGKFEVSSSKTFVPGNELTIEAGYDSKNKLIFKGIVTKQSIQIHDGVGAILIVECRDKAIDMIVGRKSITYAKKKDSDIISSIIGNYSGLSASISATETQWPEQVQYYATDWDFILTRAEANGMVVSVINGEVSVFPPDKNTTSVLEIKYGDNLLSFNADLDAVTQLANAKANSWDYTKQEVISGSASNETSGPGNLSSKKLSEVVGLSDYDVQSSAPLATADLKNWSKAVLIKSAYSKIQGELKYQGTTDAVTGKYITLAGLGDRFNGDHFVSGVFHDISHGNWVTEASIGLSPIWFSEEPDIVAPPASGLLPGVRGLFTGTVKKMYEDPDSQYRILVDLPLFDSNGEGLWARLANFYATSGAGAFFLPEVGDEVVVGFLNEDPRYPIILGSLYSATKNKPFNGLDPNEKNTTKAIVSKSGIVVKFDDENKIFTIDTPNKNTAVFSDKDKQVSIKDQNGNSIVMSESGIEIKSGKDITIEASQNLNLKGNQGVTIASSGGDVTVKGMNVSITADTQLSAKGSATAALEGGSETTIKGAMVMIN